MYCRAHIWLAGSVPVPGIDAINNFQLACYFYRAMHYSAKRGLAIACGLSVCLSVCDIGGSWPHRLKLIARTISPTSSLFVAQRSSIYSQRNMEKFWGENVRSTPTCYVHNVRLNWVNWESRDLRWRCGCLFTFVGASRGHLCDSTAFLLNGKHWPHGSENGHGRTLLAKCAAAAAAAAAAGVGLQVDRTAHVSHLCQKRSDASVGLSVYPSSKRKTAPALNTKLGRNTVHGRASVCIFNLRTPL